MLQGCAVPKNVLKISVSNFFSIIDGSSQKAKHKKKLWVCIFKNDTLDFVRPFIKILATVARTRACAHVHSIILGYIASRALYYFPVVP